MGWIHKLFCLCEHNWVDKEEYMLTGHITKVEGGVVKLQQCSKCKDYRIYRIMAGGF
jgi:hypothetical protein